MFMDAPSFVIQRRIAVPLPDVHRALADRAPLASTNLVELGSRGFLYVDEAFRPIAPLSSTQSMPTWSAFACILSDRKRVVAVVELEVAMWSDDASELQLRPIARYPERWTARRIRSYFALAHPGADEVARRLAHRAADARETADITAARKGRAQGPRVGSRTTARGYRRRYPAEAAERHGLLSPRTAPGLRASSGRAACD